MYISNNNVSSKERNVRAAVVYYAKSKDTMLAGRMVDLKNDEFKSVIEYIQSNYLENPVQINSLITFYQRYPDVAVSSLKNVVDLLTCILKNVYNYDDEQISLFLSKNLEILKSSYSDFSARLAIFNHFGMLDDVIFKSCACLTHRFTRDNFSTYTLYAVLVHYNITNIEEFNEIVSNTSKVVLSQLRKKYPLTVEMIQEYNTELKRKIKRGIRKLRLEQRMNNKGLE